MRQYDILNGGLEQLQKDLLELQNELTLANQETVEKLSLIGLQEIMNDASSAKEMDIERDLKQSYIHKGRRTKNVASNRIKNDSQKATFNEFGYGIIGAMSPYQHDDFINMSKAGYRGYSLYSPNKNSNGSWFYRDSLGTKHWTFGEAPRNTFYKAGQRIKQMYPIIARNTFRRVFK